MTFYLRMTTFSAAKKEFIIEVENEALTGGSVGGRCVLKTSMVGRNQLGAWETSYHAVIKQLLAVAFVLLFDINTQNVEYFGREISSSRLGDFFFNSGVKMTLADTKERVTRLEKILGDPPLKSCSEVVAVLDQLVEPRELSLLMQQAHTDLMKDLEAKFEKVRSDQTDLTEGMAAKVKLLEDEIAVLRRALNNPNTSEECPMSKIKVPEPKQFNGSRNAKELENFLWDMEQYFKAARIPDREQVSITSMYLSGDVKLWWRTRMADDLSAGRPSIVVWESLKKKLKDQFLPCNTSWLARENLKKLKQTGLQTWAQTELRRQGVKDIPSAMATAEGLVDFRMSSSTSSNTEKKKSVDSKKGKNTDWKKKFEGKKKEGGTTKGNELQQNKGKTQTQGCFICGGPHFARECPKKEKVNAIISQDDDACDTSCAGPSRVNPLQLLNTLSVERQQSYRDRLGLNLLESTSRIKAVNSGAMPVRGVAETTLKVGSWQGRCSLMVVPLDDFDLILGVEFFVKAKAMLLPYLRGILIGDEESPCFVQACGGTQDIKQGKDKGTVISAKQVDKGLRKGQMTYMAALVQIKPDVLRYLTKLVQY
ncbi:hypothetical protein EZV62_027229 [Acer yangbiense]|uniref:Retrotransposon gag domain-containing protein n=1 Tax=Acer yangbiense TaxID=1000413 RepID=A0A5C7GTM9_9ROSI|nr:hypothetical protein EZV62_027229 [Acer yangbiense]